MVVLSVFSQTIILLAIWITFKPVKLNVSHRINSHIIYFFSTRKLVSHTWTFFHIEKNLDLAYIVA
jgi:hypothetical protein